jgi:uncharacterized protein (TIGR03437 family)
LADRPAPISFVSSKQINFLVPAGTSMGQVPVIVRNGDVASVQVMVQNGAVLSALYALPLSVPTASLRYYATAVAITLDNGRAVFVGNKAADTRVTRAARPGETLQLFAMGLGPTVPEFYTDRLLSSVLPLRDPVSVPFAETFARVLFAGLSSSGLYQINVEIPSTLAPSEVTVKVEVGGIKNRNNVYMNRRVIRGPRILGMSPSRH